MNNLSMYDNLIDKRAVSVTMPLDELLEDATCDFLMSPPVSFPSEAFQRVEPALESRYVAGWTTHSCRSS